MAACNQTPSWWHTRLFEIDTSHTFSQFKPNVVFNHLVFKQCSFTALDLCAANERQPLYAPNRLFVECEANLIARLSLIEQLPTTGRWPYAASIYKTINRLIEFDLVLHYFTSTNFKTVYYTVYNNRCTFYIWFIYNDCLCLSKGIYKLWHYQCFDRNKNMYLYLLVSTKVT